MLKAHESTMERMMERIMAMNQGQNQNTNNTASVALPIATQTPTGQVLPSVQVPSPTAEQSTTHNPYFTLENSKMSDISVKTPGTASTLTNNTQMTPSSVGQSERDHQMLLTEKIHLPPHLPKKHS